MHKVIYLTICRISYSRIYFPSDCVSSFFSHLLNGPLFHILLKKIPILLVHTVSFLTARNILRIRVEVRFSHLHNTVQHSFAWRKLLNQLNDFRCSPRSITRVYLGSLQILLSTWFSAPSRVQPQGWTFYPQA